MAASSTSSSKYTRQQIEKFNDRIENCLLDPSCKGHLKKYLKTSRPPKTQLLKVLHLWTTVDESATFNDSEIFDMIEDIDGFNENHLYSLSEESQKVSYVKMECCRLLKQVHVSFSKYLQDNHT